MDITFILFPVFRPLQLRIENECEGNKYGDKYCSGFENYDESETTGEKLDTRIENNQNHDIIGDLTSSSFSERLAKRRYT